MIQIDKHYYYKGTEYVVTGFCNIVQGRLKVDYESSSVSLSLKPNKTDGAVMTMLANNYNVAFFMDQNDMYYPKIDI